MSHCANDMTWAFKRDFRPRCEIYAASDRVQSQQMRSIVYTNSIQIANENHAVCS
jgi:hypothetical protein